MRKLYFIYDTVADNYIYFMEAACDAVAIRSFKYACENDFKCICKDLRLFCLGELKEGNIVPDRVLVYSEVSDV